MKQKDIAIVIVIIAGSALVSLFVFSVVLGKKTSAKISVEVVKEISSEFNSPDEKHFNADSKNFTEVITIQPDSNQDPFQ